MFILKFEIRVMVYLIGVKMNYIYRCFNCGETFSKEEIEGQNQYLCPRCGSAGKNEPLKGVLKVEYDYSEIKKKYSADFFTNLTPGRFWLYENLWPLDFGAIDQNLLPRLSLPSEQLFEYELEGRKVLIQDETRNPTLSFKDRASALVALKAMELGIEEISAASTGNAGSSLAGICARLGLKSRIYVPENIPEAKRIQIETYGAKLVVVEGDYDKAFDECLADSEAHGWYNRNTAYNPLTIEGKKSAAYDIFISTKANLPDIILVPVGDGVIISGLFKGFEELLKLGIITKLPKLVAVQSEGSDAVVRFLETGKFVFHSAHTVADSISAGAPRNLFMAAKAVKGSNGFGVTVSDYEILKAQKEFVAKTGILCEPSSAATYAAFKKLSSQKQIPLSASVLLLITGNGLKDVESLKK